MQIEKSEYAKLLVADIGYTHITAAVYEIDNKQLLKGSIARLPVSSSGSAELIIETWTTAVRKSHELSGANMAGFCAAIPGPFDYVKGISYITGPGKFESIFRMAIKPVFAAALGLTTERIIFRNDAEAVLVGEMSAGTGKNCNSVMGVTLGTIFGSAFASNGNCRNLNLGSCAFKDSIADDYLSTEWFVRRYAELTGKLVSGVMELAKLTLTDRSAEKVFKEFAVNLSIFLKGHVDDLRPDVVIIGGGISNASGHFLRFVRLALTGTRVLISELGENAALIGAAESFKF